MVNKELKENRQIKLIELVFLLWFITLPFGSFIGGISIGFMTVYPSLILGVTLFAIVIPSIKSWKKSIQIFFLFLFIWVIYTSTWAFWNNSNLDWKVDLKSLILQFIYSGILFGTFYKIGVEGFKTLLKKGLFFFLSVLIIVGLFEYYTGNHVSGKFTDKLLTQEVVTDFFYAPVFIYDNPNNYLVYLIGIITLYFSISEKKSSSHWKIITILLVGFIFSLAANARIAMFICVGLILVQLYLLFKEYRESGTNINQNIFILGALFVFTLVMFQPIFIGPKYVKGQLTTEGNHIFFPKSKVSASSSENVRYNLMRNGVQLIKDNPILGIGPGQYRWKHKKKAVVHSTETVIAPHNYVIELISQYGIIGWTYFIFIFYAFVLQFKKFKKNRENLWSLLLFPVFGLISLVPSSFLSLDINWLIVPLLLIFSFESIFKESINE